MKPEQLKSKAQCIAAARAVCEARLLVEHADCDVSIRLIGDLWRLEQSFWKRADELGRIRGGDGG